MCLLVCDTFLIQMLISFEYDTIVMSYYLKCSVSLFWFFQVLLFLDNNNSTSDSVLNYCIYWLRQSHYVNLVNRFEAKTGAYWIEEHSQTRKIISIIFTTRRCAKQIVNLKSNFLLIVWFLSRKLCKRSYLRWRRSNTKVEHQDACNELLHFHLLWHFIKLEVASCLSQISLELIIS